MARPSKQEVDYFPHYCDHGKVLFILENHFGNDGYAVFYKIEEILSKTEGHCYDCSILENWEYLLSRMITSEEKVVAIIDKLAAMRIIDKPLWAEKRIWMQSFMDSITDAYARRKVSLPTKPELMYTETPLSGIDVNINPQSKVKESILKESKAITPVINDVPQLQPPDEKTKRKIDTFLLPEWIPKKEWKDYLDMRRASGTFTLAAQNLQADKLKKLVDEGSGTAAEILNQSTANGWKGLFALKGDNSGQKSVRSDPPWKNNRGNEGLDPKLDAEIDRINAEYYRTHPNEKP